MWNQAVRFLLLCGIKRSNVCSCVEILIARAPACNVLSPPAHELTLIGTAGDEHVCACEVSVHSVSGCVSRAKGLGSRHRRRETTTGGRRHVGATPHCRPRRGSLMMGGRQWVPKHAGVRGLGGCRADGRRLRRSRQATVLILLLLLLRRHL